MNYYLDIKTQHENTLDFLNVFRLLHRNLLIPILVCCKIIIAKWISHLVNGIPWPLEKIIQVL